MLNLDPKMTPDQLYKALTPQEKLKIWRKRMKFTRLQAAKCFKVSEWYYGRMERGEVPITDSPWHGPRWLMNTEKCRVFRERAGVSQEFIASQLGLSRAYVWQMENGIESPDRLLDYWEL